MEDHQKTHHCHCWNHDSELCQHKHKPDTELPNLSAEEIAKLNAIAEKEDLSKEDIEQLKKLFS